MSIIPRITPNLIKMRTALQVLKTVTHRLKLQRWVMGRFCDIKKPPIYPPIWSLVTLLTYADGKLEQRKNRRLGEK